MPKFKIEVFAPAKRDDHETDTYPIPDPENWDAFYRQQKEAEVVHVKEFSMRRNLVSLDKPVVLKKGDPEPTQLVVSDHLLGYLKADRNISVRVLGELEEQSPAAAIEKTAERKAAKKSAKPAAKAPSRKAQVA